MPLTTALNFLRLHKRRAAVTTGVFIGYTGICYKARSWESEIWRLAIAGSISNAIVECTFHFADTVNIRAKASEKSVSTAAMISKIYLKDGVQGFGKGFSACFYGAAIYGFTYFAIYKVLKGFFKDRFGDKVDFAICYLLAAFVTESLTLVFKFPFDLIKCRLQSVNQIFKYKSLPHAFTKEITTNGIGSLYSGSLPYFATYATFVTLQFSIYERII